MTVHPPKTPEGVHDFVPDHLPIDGLTFERILSAHSRIPWLERMQDRYNNMGEGCYICWLLAEVLRLRALTPKGSSNAKDAG